MGRNLNAPTTGKGAQSMGGNDHIGEAPARDKELQGIQNQYPATIRRGAVPRDDIEFHSEYQPLPATYSRTTEARRKFQFKKAVMAGDVLAPGNQAGQTTIWHATDRDLDLLYGQFQELEDRDFEFWLQGYVDLRQPGRLQHMRQLFPELIDKQISALDRQHDLEIRKKLIEKFGPQTRDDFYLKYLIESGRLQDERPAAEDYIPGMFAPQYRAIRGYTPAWAATMAPQIAIGPNAATTFFDRPVAPF